MHFPTKLALTTTLIAFSGASGFASEPFDSGRWHDLTHELSSDSVFWPTAEPFKLTTDAEGFTELGHYYSAYSFCAAEHGGTHIDAPVHFAQGRQSTEHIPLGRLIGNAVVIDVSEAAQKDRNYQIKVEDFARWEVRYGTLPSRSIILLKTNYSRFWPDTVAYLGTAKRGEAGAANLSFPGLHPQAARWLVERGVASVGIDTASIDFGRSKRFQSHVILMQANIPAFENLTKLDALTPTGSFVVALPTKIKGGSGGPLRIVAWVPDTD